MLANVLFQTVHCGVKLLKYTLFTSDLKYWVKHSKIFSYADDTTSNCQGKDLAEIMKHLEEDAANIMSYMASNGLVANQYKNCR